jgi:hypothetical protein
MKTANQQIKLFKYFAIMNLMFSPIVLSAHAQDRGGNGGGAVVCRDANDQITSAQVLDLYEGTAILGMKFIASSSYESSIKEVLDKVMTYQKDYGALLATESNFIVDSIRNNGNKVLLVSDKLERVNDSYHLALPANCKIEQAAVRLTKEQSTAFGGVLYMINKGIWNAFDDTNKAAIILHEAVYKISEKSNSLGSRAIVREILKLKGPQFHTLTAALYENGFIQLIPVLSGANYNTKEMDLSLDVTKGESVTLLVEGVRQYVVTSSGYYERRINFYVAYDPNGNVVPEKSSQPIFGSRYRYTSNSKIGWSSQNSTQITITTPQKSVLAQSNVYLHDSLFEGKTICYEAEFKANSPFDRLVISANGRNAEKVSHLNYDGTVIQFYYPNLKL